jgi:dienelactone hydrolase
VFYGIRDYGAGDGAPVPLRVFFPSLDGSVFDAPIFEGCGRFPAIQFAHGHCARAGAAHHKRWHDLPVQLARSGYVVVVPELPAMGTHPSAEDHPALGAVAGALSWLRGDWEHRDVVLPAPATGIAGHSWGGLLAARFAGRGSLRAFASLSTDHSDWSAGPTPIRRLTVPMLFVHGGPDDLLGRTTLSEQLWGSLARPKHRAVFAEGGHWDYLPAAGPRPAGTGRPPCDHSDTPARCRHLSYAAADLVTMFFAKYLPPPLAPDLPDRVPDDLVPPPLTLTPEQQFFAGGHLLGMKLIQGKPGCEYALDWDTPTDRTVPFVRFEPAPVAAQRVREADLVPRFTGGGGPGVAWVFSQSPQPGTVVAAGSTVTMALRTGPIP